MRRVVVVLGVAAGLMFVLSAPAVVAAPNKVDICHLNDAGEWQTNEVSANGNAVAAHLAHGDGLPGDEVPGMEGYMFDDACVPMALPVLTFVPIEWDLYLDDFGPGIHTIFMVAEVSPLTVEDVEDLGGRLVWGETEVVLCSNLAPDEFGEFVSIREVGDGFLWIGDGFQSNSQGEGCDINDEMADAFALFGLPTTACLSATTGGSGTEFCAPLNVIG